MFIPSPWRNVSTTLRHRDSEISEQPPVGHVRKHVAAAIRGAFYVGSRSLRSQLAGGPIGPGESTNPRDEEAGEGMKSAIPLLAEGDSHLHARRTRSSLAAAGKRIRSRSLRSQLADTAR